MIRNSLLILLVAGAGWILLQVFLNFSGNTVPNDLASYYAQHGPDETGSANLVTAVVVTYRGLDTLGEVTILFLTAAIIGFMLKADKLSEDKEKRAASEFFITAAKVLLPIIFLVGVYIFMNGHLSPGGGFQGGAVIASAMILYILSFSHSKSSHALLETTEAISGFGFVFLAVLGLFLAGGFLDNKILPLGNFGELFSAGAIPLIYSLVGLKVGAELSKIIVVMNETQGEEVK